MSPFVLKMSIDVLRMARSMETFLHDKPLNTIFYEHSSHQGILLDGLNSLWQKGELLDISLIVEGRVFRAHRAVLAACSDYFRAMFTDNMLEARQTEICLNGISARGMFYYANDWCSNLKELFRFSSTTGIRLHCPLSP